MKFFSPKDATMSHAERRKGNNYIKIWNNTEFGILSHTWLNLNALILNPIRNKGSIILVRPLSINKNPIWHPQILASTQDCPQRLMQMRHYTSGYVYTTFRGQIKALITLWSLVYQSPIMRTISASGLGKGRGIMLLLPIIKGPNPPEALWKLIDGW